MHVKNNVRMKKSDSFVCIYELILMGMKDNYTDK